ncbi:CAZyme family GH76 [Aspergillus niger]|nr:CAZyme family GH76 [Aspergillus niger]
MGSGRLGGYAAVFAGLVVSVSAIDFNINSTDTIKSASTIEITNLLSTANFNGTVNPIYSSSYPEGMLYMSLIPYWNATGNTTYNEFIISRMHNHSQSIFSGEWEEIDVLTSDFVTWGLAAMAASEADFPGSPTNSSWLTWAKKVAYTMELVVSQGSICNGGLYDDESQTHGTEFDWFNNGAYFQLISRVAYASVGDDQGTYAQYGASAWSWSEKNGMVNTTDWWVYDLVSNKTVNASTCQAVDTARWSLAYGFYLSGAAYMYEATKSDVWMTRAEGLLNSTLDTFFLDDIMVEVGYSSASLGTAEQSKLSAYPFKGFLALCLASVANLIPEFAGRIVPLLADTAVAVAEQCDGTSNQTVCGSDWGSTSYNKDPSFENTWNAANIFASKLLAPEISESGNTTSSGNSTTSNTASKDGSGISNGAIAGAVVGAVAGVALIIAAVFFSLRQRKQKRIPVPTKEPDEIEYAKKGPAELAQGSYVPEMDNGVVTELPGKVDGEQLNSSVPHEVDSAPVSELPVRVNTMRYELE